MWTAYARILLPDRSPGRRCAREKAHPQTKGTAEAQAQAPARILRTATRLVQSRRRPRSRGQPVSVEPEEPRFREGSRGGLRLLDRMADSPPTPPAALPPNIFSNVLSTRTVCQQRHRRASPILLNTSWTNELYTRKALIKFLANRASGSIAVFAAPGAAADPAARLHRPMPRRSSKKQSGAIASSSRPRLNSGRASRAPGVSASSAHRPKPARTDSSPPAAS